VKRMVFMSLSVCLITRNEEKSLERALRSVAGIADELIVADTGSTDRTVAIAAELGAQVHAFAWDDDFSAARNFTLIQAKGDWIYWLNPDEEISSTSLTLIREAILTPDALAFAVKVQELIRPDDMNSFTETVQVRLFLHLPEVRFLGRLHPSFSPPLEDLARQSGKKIYLSAITMRRHAYLSQLTEAKLRWAAQLLERELQDRPGRLHFLIEYGRTLLLLNDPRGHQVLADAVEQVLPIRQEAQPASSTVQLLLEYLMTVSPEQSRSRLTAEEARELALHWFPQSPPLLWRIAQQRFQSGEVGKAAELLERLIELGRTGAYDKSEGFDPSIIGVSAIMNLSVCYTHLRELEKAERCLLPLLTDPTHQGQAVQGLAAIQRLRQQATD